MGEVITAVIAFAVSWLSKGKIIKAETKSAEANAIAEMQKAYDKYVEHNNKQMQKLEGEVQNLHSELKRVEGYWRKKYNSLKSEFSKYRSTHP